MLTPYKRVTAGVGQRRRESHDSSKPTSAARTAAATNPHAKARHLPPPSDDTGSAFWLLPDVMATVLDVTRTPYPAELGGRGILPLEGESFLPALKGKRWDRSPLFWEHEGNAAVREGKWKLVRNFTAARSATPGFDTPGRRGGWELYDMTSDRTELHDLSAEYPEVVKHLTAAYEKWEQRCGVRNWEKILASADLPW